MLHNTMDTDLALAQRLQMEEDASARARAHPNDAQYNFDQARPAQPAAGVHDTSVDEDLALALKLQHDEELRAQQEAQLLHNARKGSLRWEEQQRLEAERNDPSWRPAHAQPAYSTQQPHGSNGRQAASHAHRRREKSPENGQGQGQGQSPQRQQQQPQRWQQKTEAKACAFL